MLASNRGRTPRVLADAKISTNEDWPPFEDFDFEVAEFAKIPEPLIKRSHRFEVATLEIKKRGFFGRKVSPQVVIKRERIEGWQYVEKLSERLDLELVKIPAGPLKMGADEEELKSRDSERPVHNVMVPKFYMGKYVVTQAQWWFGAALPEINRSIDPNPSHFKGDNLPVERVKWQEAIEFCARLSAHTGREYRLPSEAEWEYACRAGTQTPFHFGKTIDPRVANYDGNYTYGDGQKGAYREKTMIVGSLGVANKFGLYDMHGNVWEWCQDHWHNTYEGVPVNGEAWINPPSSEGAFRVLRGGSWRYDPVNCRSAVRFFSDAVIPNYYVGFRLVLTVSTL
jgi:formylglycine-generating enzyme required for sulfatase activity